MLKKWFCCNGCVRCDEFSVCEPFQLIANRRCNSFTLMVFMNKQPIQITSSVNISETDDFITFYCDNSSMLLKRLIPFMQIYFSCCPDI